MKRLFSDFILELERLVWIEAQEKYPADIQRDRIEKYAEARMRELAKKVYNYHAHEIGGEPPTGERK